MSVRPVLLDFARGACRPVPGGRAALLVALAGISWAAVIWFDARTSLDYFRAQQEVLARKQGGPSRPQASARDLRELGNRVNAVNVHVRALNIPWEEILRAVEPPRAMRVGLLSMDTSGRNGVLHLTGVASRYEEIADYVSLLVERKAVGAAYLSRHEMLRGGGYRFDVEVEWRQAR